MARRAGPMILPLVLTTTLGGFVWCTHYPDHPWIEAAQDWPVVGEWVGQFRVAYLGPAAAKEETGAEGEPAGREGSETPAPPSEPIDLTSISAAELRDRGFELPKPRSRLDRALKIADRKGSVSETTAVPGPVRVPGDREASSPGRTSRVSDRHAFEEEDFVVIPTIEYVALEWKWFLPGQKLHDEPDLEAEIVESLHSLAYLPIIRRDGVWVQVVLAEQERWVDTTWQPPHSRKKARRGILRHRYNPVQSNSYWRLGPVQKLLGIKRANRKLGAYNLWTDVTDEELLSFLDSAAIVAEEAYFARYGRLPSGNPQRSVALFRERDTYESYAAEFGLAPGGTAGHASLGVAAFFAGQGSRGSLTRTLVHEICHLLNNRSLAWDLPPWLEEGMASDLGAVWIEHPPGVAPEKYETDLFNQGHVSRLLFLESLIEKGELHSLAALLNFDRETFYRPDLVRYAYSYGAVFITFLLDDEARAEGFRSFLHQIAVGRRADLFENLGKEGPSVEQEFLAWLQVEIEENRKNMDRIAQRYRNHYL